MNLQAGPHVQYVHDGRVSAHYLDVLAIQPAMGRNFSADEDRPHGPNTALLSYGLWHSLFGEDRNILGQAILLKGAPYTVIGVLPQGATTPLNADIYTAIQASRDGEGGGTNFDAITRLRDGATWQEANAQINRAWSLRTGRYELQNNPGAQVTYYSVPLQTGQTAKLRPQVLALMLASRLDPADRLRQSRRVDAGAHDAAHLGSGDAAGAGSLALADPETVLDRKPAAGTGGRSGWARYGFLRTTRPFVAVAGGFLPVAGVSLDGRVMAFTLVVSLLTSVLFGMLPALGAAKVDLRSSMSSRAVAGTGSQRLRQTLIAGEVALTVVLLAASGLLIRTLIQPGDAAAGVQSQGCYDRQGLAGRCPLSRWRRLSKLLDQSTAAIRQIPGVQQAAVGLSLPYERALNNGGLIISDGKEAGQAVQTDVVYVTPGYFEALQMPVRAGRTFSEADGPDSQRVAIVNQTFVRKFFHGANPVGRYLDKNMMIVGVVDDVPVPPGLDATAPLTGEETMYIPATQVDPRFLGLVHVWFQPSWIVRTAGPVEGLTAQMQRALASADPNLPFSGFYSMSDLLAKTLATQRVEVALLSDGGFSFAAERCGNLLAGGKHRGAEDA